MKPHLVSPTIAGLLSANAIPHAYAAVTGATHVTPLAGRSSGPVVNGVWAGLNLAAATAVTRARLDPSSSTERRAFKAGVLGFSAWVLASEWLTDLY